MRYETPEAKQKRAVAVGNTCHQLGCSAAGKAVVCDWRLPDGKWMLDSCKAHKKLHARKLYYKYRMLWRHFPNEAATPLKNLEPSQHLRLDEAGKAAWARTRRVTDPDGASDDIIVHCAIHGDYRNPLLRKVLSGRTTAVPCPKCLGGNARVSWVNRYDEFCRIAARIDVKVLTTKLEWHRVVSERGNDSCPTMLCQRKDSPEPEITTTMIRGVVCKSAAGCGCRMPGAS